MIFLTFMFACSGGKTDVEMDCGDGVDDDNDGLVDCADWDCSAACLGEYEEDTNTPDDTGKEEEEEKEEDSGDTQEPQIIECFADSYQNEVTGTYGGNEYSFNAVMWDGVAGEVALFFVNDTTDDVNYPCSQANQGILPKSSLFIRSFNLGSFPTQVQFVEPRGGDENYATLVDEDNDVKDAALTGSISLDDFDFEAQTEGLASSLSITEFAEGTGSFSANSINACYCPGLIVALDEAQ